MSCDGWTLTSVANITNINGESYSVNESWDYVNYLDTGNITRNRIDKIEKITVGSDKLPSRARRKVKSGDIVYSTVRPNQQHYGIIKKPVDNMLVSTGFAVIKTKEELANNDFLYWYLSQQHLTDYLHTVAENSTSAYPSIKPSDICMLKLWLPPLTEQRAIASILSSLDDKIELNNRMNKTLEEITQTLFKRWFVDFEFPDENGNPYKSSGGKMVDSDLGMIPDGWRVGCIDYLGTIVGGGTPSKARDDYFCDSGIAWITPKDLSNTSNKYIAHGAIDITHDGYKNSSTQLMPSGTVLFSSRAPIGYLAIANNEITTNQGFKSIVPNKGFGSEFVYYMMKLISPDIENQATGSTFKEVSGGELKRFPILLPKTSISTDFSIIADSLGKFRQKSEQQSSLLIQLRDTLLPKLMSGEIRVAISEEKSNEQQT